MNISTALAGLVISALCGSVAFACGDKLSAIGGGVRFERIHASRNPGRIVLYVPAGSNLARANDEARLAVALIRARHQVELIDTPAALTERLTAGTTNLLLIDARDMPDPASLSHLKTTVVPVTYASGASAQPASDGGARCVLHLTKRSAQQLVLAVDAMLERLGRGESSGCLLSPGPRGT
jgi:hypothetical protein